MTVYADVLIAVNTLVNFFIILLCAKINRQRFKNWRIILGALVGGVFSLTIFLPISNSIIDGLIKVISASFMIYVSFGFKKIKVFLRNVAVLFLSTYLFAGIVFAVWYLFKPQKIIINNSVVYFDISLLFLIITVVVVYLIITVFSSLLKKEAITAKNCGVSLFLEGRKIELNTMFDTGNSLSDPLSDFPVIIVNKIKLYELCLGEINFVNMPDRYRIIPCRTVSGDVLLEGVRCDNVQIEFEGKLYKYDNPIAVISKTPLTDEFDAVLNPEILI